MKTKLLTLFAALLCGLTTASAVNFDLQFDTLHTNSTTKAPTSVLVLLIASTTDTTFQVCVNCITPGQSLAVNALFGTTDDMILWRGNAMTNGTSGVVIEAPSVNYTGNWNLGDPLGVL